MEQCRLKSISSSQTAFIAPVTESEKQEILTPFVAQRIKTFNHDARDLMQFVNLGETPVGIPIELNKKLTEYDHTIIIGGISFHYFAGFSGGRKLICPGLASARTISGTHELAFDFAEKTRTAGVEVGRLKGNTVHEAFTEVVENCPPTFAINSIVNNQGEIIDLICGNWKTAHEKACEIYAENNTFEIEQKREIVVVSCGGSPYDLNLIQAHKALEMASRACTEGGTIIFIAKCADGLGRKDFLNWFDSKTSNHLADRLCRSYKVNGQTAWSLLKKSQSFDIRIITDLLSEVTSKMGLKKIEDLQKTTAEIDDSSGYILPFGAKFKIET